MQPRRQFDTGVDVGSNETARTSADPGRPGRLRGRYLAARGLAAGLLVAVAALLTLPLQAEAQKTTFVSNTGQSTATSLRGIGPTGIGSFFYSQAQRFSTGSNEGGYTLSAIKVQADNFESASSPRVSIYTVTSDNPGTLLYVLTNPATLNDNAINTFRAPANATLEKDTDYFVVFEATGSGSNTRYDLKGTVSANEDSGTASGWSIADTSRERATNSGNWSSVFARLKIAVRGTIPPAISIADASAAENAVNLMFDVTLSRSFQNTVKVDFETISGGTATEGVDYHARRTYTHVILAGDKTAQMGFALIEDTVAAAGETVKVRLSNARVVDAYGDKIKDLDITRAEATGTITAPTTTTTNVPGLTIRIKDATGDEDSGWLVFKVRLSRKHDDYVCYDFETISGGTAMEGTDYLKFPKATYWMQIGKRVDKPFVRIIDDSVNDNGETVKVKISNARLCNDASQTLSITRAEATGTIRNSDPLPAEEANLSVAGPLLTLGYPGPLDVGSKPSPRDFVVSAEAPGGAKDMVAVAAVSLHGPDVFLQLGRPVAPDETVVLTYLTAAMHPIHDAAGLLAAPLADEPVRNDTGASGPLAEAALAAGTAIPVPLAELLEAAQEGAGTERLDLSSRNLTDLSALAGLTDLRELDLSDNAITDLSPLAGLTGLEVLNLSGNRIADLWPLAGLTALERLSLADNRIADLSPLAGLTGLEVLNLSGNRIADLWPLAGLTALERLSLADNRIADLWPLTGLSGLEVLLLDRNRVADVLALSQLAGLANLGLAGNRIADIGLLAELGGLRRLDLSGNAVADVSALGDLSGLVWLRLPGNPVSDAAPLGRLEKLRWLWLDSGTAAGMEALAPPAGRGAAAAVDRAGAGAVSAGKAEDARGWTATSKCAASSGNPVCHLCRTGRRQVRDRSSLCQPIRPSRSRAWGMESPGVLPSEVSCLRPRTDWKGFKGAA